MTGNQIVVIPRDFGDWLVCFECGKRVQKSNPRWVWVNSVGWIHIHKDSHFKDRYQACTTISQTEFEERQKEYERDMNADS